MIREFTEDLANFKGYRVEAVAVGPLRFLGPNHVVVDGGFDVVGPTPPKMALCVRRHATAHS